MLFGEITDEAHLFGMLDRCRAHHLPANARISFSCADCIPYVTLVFEACW